MKHSQHAVGRGLYSPTNLEVCGENCKNSSVGGCQSITCNQAFLEFKLAQVTLVKNALKNDATSPVFSIEPLANGLFLLYDGNSQFDRQTICH